MPQRIQLRRTKGWRKPEGAIVVSRPSKWGNPFQVCRTRGKWEVEIIDDLKHRHVYGSFITKLDATQQAVDLYRWHVEHGLYDPDRYDLTELTGKDLCCWCPLTSVCHADVLLAVSNVIGVAS
jgi:uncharacterized protein DUF4326